MTKALITGISGQDGSYLAELLLEKGYTVIGLDHPQSTVSYEYLQPLVDKIHLVQGDLQNQISLEEVLSNYYPDEVYNLAALSFPPDSWDKIERVGEITALGVTRLLEAMRKIVPQARFYQASSSEMFGHARISPQNETTPFHPRNPYGIAKLFAHWITVNYREKYGMFAVSGILFNHESPRRGMEYVTRKITRGAALIKMGLSTTLTLGNIDARRDWGFAGDYVRAMWMMLQHSKPDDFVVGTGETHTVREICECSFRTLDLDYRDYITQDKQLIRPIEEVQLVADARKAYQQLGWEPSLSFDQLIAMMVNADLKELALRKK